MPETSKSLFYNSQNGDRLYDADSFEHLLKKFFASGVFAGSCQVTASGGMMCSVGDGYANCDGKVRVFDEPTQLTFENAHPTFNRIDTVVIERNDTNREITIKVVKGTAANNPEPTEPVRENGIYQLVLAEVYIAAGATSIAQGAITDKRPYSDVCGYVVNAVQTPDFSELYAQFEEQASHFVETQEEEFLQWFDEMKDQLSEDAAGNLQNEVDGLDNRLTPLENDAGNKVKLNAQVLTDEQKAQVLINIGAIAAMEMLRDMLVTETKTLVDNLSLQHNDYFNATYSVAKTGYMPIGLVGYQVGNATNNGVGCTLVTINRLMMAGNNVSVQFRNIHASADSKIKLSVAVLYKKNIVFPSVGE